VRNEQDRPCLFCLTGFRTDGEKEVSHTEKRSTLSQRAEACVEEQMEDVRPTGLLYIMYQYPSVYVVH
jgi:hypothetical protein